MLHTCASRHMVRSDALSSERNHALVAGSVQVQGLAIHADKELLSAVLQLLSTLPKTPRRKHTAPKQPSTAKRKGLQLAGMKLEVHDIELSYTCQACIPQHLARRPDASAETAAAGSHACSAQLTIGCLSGEVQPSLAHGTASCRDLQLQHWQQSSPSWEDPASASSHQEVVLQLGHFSASAAKAGCDTLPAIPCVDAQLAGLQLAFEADHLFAACGMAAEILGTCKASTAPTSQKSYEQSLAQPAMPIQHPPQEVSSAPEAQQATGVRLQPGLPPVTVHAHVQDVAVTAHFMHEVCWGVSLASSHLTLSPVDTTAAASLAGLAVQLNGQCMVRCGTAAASLLSLGGQDPEPDAGPTTEAEVAAALRRASGSLAGSSNSLSSVVVASSPVGPHTPSRPEQGAPLPERPYNGKADQVSEAYRRAQLPSTWHPPYLRRPEVLNLGQSAPTADAQMLPQPSLTIEACVQDCVVSLPHECELGMAIRGSELWARAFELALKECLQPMNGGKRRSSASGGRRRGEQPPIQLLVCLRSVSFRMDMHPMEVRQLCTRGSAFMSSAAGSGL